MYAYINTHIQPTFHSTSTIPHKTGNSLQQSDTTDNPCCCCMLAILSTIQTSLPLSFAPGAYQDSAVLISRGNCTFADKILYAQAAGGGAVVIAQNSPQETTFAPTGSPEEFAAVSIPTGMISRADAEALAANLSSAGAAGVYVTMFVGLSGTDQIFRFSNTVLLVLAVVVVTCGCLLAHPRPSSDALQRLPEHSGAAPPTTVTDEIETKHVVMAFVFISLFLVAMYFLFDYLVYLFIAFFVIGATASMSQPALLYINPCLVSVTLLQACVRSDLRTMWEGKNATRRNSGEALAGGTSRLEFGSTDSISDI
ncbi:hypothetical protein SARC_07369 [Sphaeroforma arctica JP610]|uniref:PA domain-containing protein n=1 Tax=Sphaeroforma arctica JP610 TaxID=667725 RepID=A0A0L0FTV8_9EUKA|nr:hypothetical protein SARC_07369 [Sphaeroforma arctica JP610]KNC80275.1 hypothetical protein SARC_07369 [Sphaeroforma arctica JP610]|eukprot:XP_014154177.1 hypothetical protein SARC_07369 [Sphaeroforma arctica JP610]